MLINIEPHASVPIYEQIVVQVTYGIAAGDPGAGELIDSVRKLAERLEINPNTVARAYQELERLGLVVERRGLGMEVTAEGPARARARRQEIVRGRIRQALREAVASALPADEVRKLVEEELARANGRAQRREKH